MAFSSHRASGTVLAMSDWVDTMLRYMAMTDLFLAPKTNRVLYSTVKILTWKRRRIKLWKHFAWPSAQKPGGTGCDAVYLISLFSDRFIHHQRQIQCICTMLPRLSLSGVVLSTVEILSPIFQNLVSA